LPGLSPYLPEVFVGHEHPAHVLINLALLGRRQAFACQVAVLVVYLAYLAYALLVWG